VKALPGRLVLLGHPVAHALSPRIQNAALRAAGISIGYEALDVRPAELPGALDALRSIGGAGNVTVPHKPAVAAQCDELTALARRAEAVNTFWCEDGRLIGDNTDVSGFQAAVTELLGRAETPRPRSVAVLGAGGAAAAVLAAIEQWPDTRARVFSRSSQRTRALCARFADLARAVSSAEEAVRRADLVVNATPIGLADGAMPIDPRHLEGGTAVLDLVYGRGGTAWTRAAAQLGLRARDGTTMLIEQGALAFERWFGVPADRAVMREALQR
jgi:shikimate dehydrogenase